MKTRATLVLLCLLAAAAGAQTSLPRVAERVKEDCWKEIDMYCRTVAPGEGRVFACLYAHSEKLAALCEVALYDASTELEYAVSRLNYVAISCADDLEKYCIDIEPGEGRVANCLKRNQSKATTACQQAIKDTGLGAK